MRRHERNAAAEPIIEALIARGEPLAERDAREMLRYVLRVEREGFAQRLLRRLPEARHYHGSRTRNGDELLSSKLVEAIIREEVGK